MQHLYHQQQLHESQYLRPLLLRHIRGHGAWRPRCASTAHQHSCHGARINTVATLDKQLPSSQPSSGSLSSKSSYLMASRRGHAKSSTAAFRARRRPTTTPSPHIPRTATNRVLYRNARVWVTLQAIAQCAHPVSISRKKLDQARFRGLGLRTGLGFEV